MAIKLITTARTPIIDNRIILPLVPIGEIPRGQAWVYSSMEASAEWFDGVTIINENGFFYAQFDCDVIGEAVVSCITDNGT